MHEDCPLVAGRSDPSVLSVCTCPADCQLLYSIDSMTVYACVPSMTIRLMGFKKTPNGNSMPSHNLIRFLNCQLGSFAPPVRPGDSRLKKRLPIWRSWYCRVPVRCAARSTAKGPISYPGFFLVKHSCSHGGHRVCSEFSRHIFTVPCALTQFSHSELFKHSFLKLQTFSSFRDFST